MYNLPYFKEKDDTVVIDFVKNNPFAILCGSHANKPVVTQVPMFLDIIEEKIFLSGHIMRNTDHHKAFLSNAEVLAVFSGPDQYISASWYENPRQASTWNYQSVHMRGVLKFLGESELLKVLKRTTDHFENDPHSGSNFDDLPQSYIQPMLNAIVAFSIEINQVDNVFKLSQNKDEKTYSNIISKLKGGSADAVEIAKQMESRKSKLFSSE